LFEIAFAQRDQARGREYFHEFICSDWARRFDQADLLPPYEARYEMLEQKWEAAVERFRRYFQSIQLGPGNYQESLARHALDYGDALFQDGRTAEAIDIWRAAATLPGDAGNRPWQTIIRRRLA
jgi:tetratricopeptide (TPR) repeat protein